MPKFESQIGSAPPVAAGRSLLSAFWLAKIIIGKAAKVGARAGRERQVPGPLLGSGVTLRASQPSPWRRVPSTQACRVTCSQLPPPSPPHMLQGKMATRRILLFTRKQEPLKVGGLAADGWRRHAWLPVIHGNCSHAHALVLWPQAGLSQDGLSSGTALPSAFLIAGVPKGSGLLQRVVSEPCVCKLCVRMYCMLPLMPAYVGKPEGAQYLSEWRAGDAARHTAANS